MSLLLLSLGVGAVPNFIAANVRSSAADIRIAYLDDAARPYAGEDLVAAERQQLADLGHSLVDVSAADFADPASFAATIDSCHVLYVAGGNTFVLLAALRRAGADAVIVERVRAGMPYIGSSAGSIVAGTSIEPASLMDDPAEAPDLISHAGLALVDAVSVPHADGVLPPYPPELIASIAETYADDYALTFLRDDQALLVADGKSRVIDSL